MLLDQPRYIFNFNDMSMAFITFFAQLLSRSPGGWAFLAFLRPRTGLAMYISIEGLAAAVCKSIELEVSGHVNGIVPDCTRLHAFVCFVHDQAWKAAVSLAWLKIGSSSLKNPTKNSIHWYSFEWAAVGTAWQVMAKPTVQSSAWGEYVPENATALQADSSNMVIASSNYCCLLCSVVFTCVPFWPNGSQITQVNDVNASRRLPPRGGTSLGTFSRADRQELDFNAQQDKIQTSYEVVRCCETTKQVGSDPGYPWIRDPREPICHICLFRLLQQDSLVKLYHVAESERPQKPLCIDFRYVMICHIIFSLIYMLHILLRICLYTYMCRMLHWYIYDVMLNSFNLSGLGCTILGSFSIFGSQSTP